MAIRRRIDILLFLKNFLGILRGPSAANHQGHTEALL